MKQKLLACLATLLVFWIAPNAVHATHNRAGEIHVEQIGPLTVRATIITWTKASSTNADRDTLTICWGDGSCETVLRANGPGNEGVVLPNDIKYNLYIAVHKYEGVETYRISMTDPNRIVGIINVNPPASDNVPFHIETIYSFQDPQFSGKNTTPYLLQPPIDNACVGKPFKHNPNAYDPDGDSLSYHLIIPLQSEGTPVPNYSFPDDIGPGVFNVLNLDPVTGDLTWIAPQKEGEYNVAFIIVSWRDGQPIDTTIRDMQIFVDKCNNNPPVVEAPDELCVVAGTLVQFPVYATDPDTTGDLVELTARGGPFETVYSPASFTVAPGFQVPPVTGTFRWQTTCEHISNQPYSVVFKAIDSISKNFPQLSDLKTVEIKVVGPPPLDVKADAQFGEVEISWEKPYACEDAAENYFLGFSVWRREGSNPFDVDTCMPGLAGKGYTELVLVTRQDKDGRYYYMDEQVERGRTYCYRVLAKFARTSTNGYAYNIVESLASDEVCVQLPRDLPLITNVSVLETDAVNGEMEVRWSKPVAADLDTVINFGPYVYQVFRAPGLSGGTFDPVPGAIFSSSTFWQANDTAFVDNGLNTSGQPYRYKIAFFVRGDTEALGYTNEASSVFLNINATDNTNILSWQEDVPWGNYRHDVYRLNTTTSVYDSIGFSTSGEYRDTNLINGKEYCYYVRSVGTYSIGGVVNPIYNNSQKKCGTPIDNVLPCPPTLSVQNLCNDPSISVDPDPPYENKISWNNPNLSCPGTDDVTRYVVYFAPDPDATFTQLAVIDGADNTTYVHSLDAGLAGCYTVSTIDSVGNEGPQSAQLCTDNCPKYELPNAFTPNDDGRNDLFTPFPGWRFVERVDFQVFNRWGNPVFATTDPNINWDGKTESGKELAEGTYFYVCKVYEQRVDGVTLRPEPLSGYIELVRGNR